MDSEFKWAPEALYSKAVLFASYAQFTASDSPLFGLWSSLSIELLARAALAKIHPSLLADPREHQNIMYGFGVRTQREPLSIPARTVFSRCRLLISEFDDAAEAHCQLLAGIRNRELHTGEDAFDSLVHNRWLADHYRVATILIKHLSEKISDFFAQETISALETILEERSKEVEARAKKAVASCKRWYGKLTAAKKAKLIKDIERLPFEGPPGERWILQACPACGNQGVLSGGSVQRVHASLDEDGVVQNSSIISSSFKCRVCPLALTTHNDVYFAGLPSTFEVTQTLDPVEHVGINPEDYFDTDDMARILERSGLYVVEPDYGNE